MEIRPNSTVQNTKTGMHHVEMTSWTGYNCCTYRDRDNSFGAKTNILSGCTGTILELSITLDNYYIKKLYWN